MAKKPKTSTRTTLAKAGHRKPPAARSGKHLTTREDRVEGRYRSQFTSNAQPLDQIKFEFSGKQPELEREFIQAITRIERDKRSKKDTDSPVEVAA